MVSDFSLSEPKKTTAGQSTGSDTTPAISTLVSNHPQDVGGLSSSTSPNPGHYPEPHKSGVHNEVRGPNTGHMACLRESFASQGVSAQASELLLSSWRSKMNSSYNSLFSKWASWCEQRNRDPTAGPVEDVVNCLAVLHAE